MATIANLQECALLHLTAFTDPNGDYAFWAYDRVGDPDRLDPVDMFAPGLLDAPLLGSEVIGMFQPNGDYRVLRDAMQAVLDDRRCRTARFEDIDLDDPEGPWALVRAALKASGATKNIKASKVTKILHRKRPDLVPIFDSRLAAFYETSPRTPWLYWPPFQADVRANSEWLSTLAATVTTADRRSPLSLIRTADIIVWTHKEESCTM